MVNLQINCMHGVIENVIILPLVIGVLMQLACMGQPACMKQPLLSDTHSIRHIDMHAL